MKIKLICALLALTISAAFVGCGSDGSGTPSSENQSNAEDETEGAKDTETEDGKNEDSNTPEDQQATGESEDSQEGGDLQNDDSFVVEVELSQLEPMEKAFDTLLLSCQESGLTYDSQDPVFFWTALYYGIVNYRDQIPLAETVESELRAPRMAVQEFATGLFADYSDLPEIPAEITNIRYDDSWDAYLFALSDRGQTYTRLLNAYENGEGSIRAAAVLYNSETDSPIACSVFLIEQNSFADGIVDPLFPYTVSSMTPSEAVTTNTELPVLTGSFQSFSDGHTAEFLIDGNLMAFQVYDKEILSLLSQLKEDAQVTLALDINEETETKTIVSLVY